MLTAGGHIHVGGTFVKMLSYDQLCLLVKEMDDKVLPKCIEIESKWGELRRSIYGSPGEFRIKDYGIEYRSPSNAIFQQGNVVQLQQVLTEVEGTVKGMALT